MFRVKVSFSIQAGSSFASFIISKKHIMHNLVVAEYIVASDFPRADLQCICSDFIMKCRNRRPGMYGNLCRSRRLGLIIAEICTTTDRPTPRVPPVVSGAQYVPVRLESRYLTDSRFCLSVRPAMPLWASGCGGQTPRQIHKDDRSCSFVPESL